MNGDTILGMIIMTFCNLLCAGTFYGIGVWAAGRKDPMHFYSGTTVDPGTISDIPAYNRENAKMWKTFSLPFWLSGFCAILSLFIPWLSTVSIVLMVAGCTFGIGWLVWKYNSIFKRYQKGRR